MRTILKIMCYFTIKEISGVSTLFTLLKWVFFEGRQREFFPARRAKIVENVVGCLGLLHNRYDFQILADGFQYQELIFNLPILRNRAKY
jgi:hypothetical protein